MKYYDIAIIGGGPGGYAAAIRASQLGANTVIIEMDELGGTCLNYGCIPSKALISIAETYNSLKNSNKLFDIINYDLDYSKIITHKNELVQKIRNNVKKHLISSKVSIIYGSAYFLSRNKLNITDSNKNEYTIYADKIIIATGSKANLPKYIKYNHNIINSDKLFEINELPKDILIIGGGYIGCEIACMLSSFGVKVVLIEKLNNILNHLDDDIIKVVKKFMLSTLNISIYENITIDDIKQNNGIINVKTNSGNFTTELLLNATGRKPNVEYLNIENIGVELKDTFIKIDEYNQTTVPNIYAIGDITNNMQLAHSANSQGVYTAEHSCGINNNINESIIPGVIFTIPEIGYVGLSEKKSRTSKNDILIYKSHFKNLSKSIITGDTIGFAKWITDKNTNQILGASVVGKSATELISEATIAVREELTISDIKQTVHAHPTLSEIWYEAVK